MSEAGNQGIPPGWYNDPAGSSRQRWWNGTAWTDQLSDPGPYGGSTPGYSAGHPAGYPAGYPMAGYQPERPRISDQTPVYNPLIWVITLLPLVTVALLLVWNPDFSTLYVDPSGDYNPTMDPGAIFTPAYLLLVGSSFPLYGATVVLAYFDSERLKKDGVVRPFHWAWSFLGTAVYVIGRSVIVRKVAPGRGLVPVWVLIGVIVLSIIVSTMKITAMTSSMINTLSTY
ncbi:DUF2510 domain-containing protein [Pseudarthrobacter sp. J64]|uniref:DUF2510 domain-containing protein n=1 Tax=Pseudarthrobacter sp. J64 TaxID=3116485 RepID=UPI002E81FD98|nr:DUF2510 domain-containing protein [Pseudarthrobacter sp. J64]MEE2569977.1 DUF2510 domain-containing protein [Pseudarthrobacter sp. J64]